METAMTFQNKRLIGIVFGIGLLLLVPFTAMKLTGEVQWSAFDFVLAGALLLGTGFAIELVLRTVTQFKYRVAICAAIMLALLIVWAEIATGVFGTRFAGS